MEAITLVHIYIHAHAYHDGTSNISGSTTRAQKLSTRKQRLFSDDIEHQLSKCGGRIKRDGPVRVEGHMGGSYDVERSQIGTTSELACS